MQISKISQTNYLNSQRQSFGANISPKAVKLITQQLGDKGAEILAKTIRDTGDSSISARVSQLDGNMLSLSFVRGWKGNTLPLIIRPGFHTPGSKPLSGKELAEFLADSVKQKIRGL